MVATILLISITLVSAITTATFFFGVFGSSAAGPRISIVPGSVNCYSDTSANLNAGACVMKVRNTGGAVGFLTGCGPAGVLATINTTQVAPATQVGLKCSDLPGLLPRSQQITGFVTQLDGPILQFSVVVQ